MAQASHEKVIEIPVSVFESADTKEDLEDWLMAHDPVFIEELRKIKADAANNKGRPLTEVARKWNTKP